MSRSVPHLMNTLAAAAVRTTAAAELARCWGAEDLLILIRDPELRVFCPAHGFRQTLPGGASWRELLHRCKHEAEFRAEVAYPDSGRRSVAHVFQADEAAVVFLGDQVRVSRTDLEDAGFPVLFSLMKAERAAAVADSKAVAADNASERAAELASTLDRARSEVQVKAVQLQEALRESARLNDELQALNDTLEHRVADRSRELEAEVAQRREIEARLAQAQKMKAVGQLTAGIAHDFNNLLTVVLGNLEALHEQLADRPALARLAEQASAAGWRGATTTRRLLAFSRQQPLHPQPLDVPHLLQGMAGLMRQSLGETIGLTIESTADPWRCMADPAELETALLNLALNARDAMPNGGTLTIKLANVAIDDDGPTENEGLQPGQYVVLAVNDTGTGMTPETLEHVFEPFFTTKAVDNGSGLGLSMVHGFVHQSGGHVAIDSEPGAGTTVRLYLPRAAGEASTPEVCAPRAAAVSDGSKRILVVEDNDLVRQHVTSQLESLGYAVVAVPDAQAALAALQHDGEFDLLFSDVVMPGGMSGFDLAEAVQRSRPGLPVLLTSGYTEKDDLMGEGPTAQFELLRKPYRRHQLAERVRAALERKPDLPD